MLLSLVSSLAFAGDLLVTTASPVVVKVDGTALDYIPGTMVVQVSGLSGIHAVQITSVTGAVLKTMNVSVPQQGGSSLVWDGRNLALATAGADGALGSVGGVTATIGIPGLVIGMQPPAPAPAAAPTAMDAGAFASLLGAVKSAAFSDDKVGAVRTAAAGNWFTIDQVGRLVDAVSFSADKLAVVQVCRPKVVDPQSAFSLGPHFTFSGDREAAMALFQ